MFVTGKGQGQVMRKGFLIKKRKSEPFYILILSCRNETAEKAAFSYVNQYVRKNTIKKKTVMEHGVELICEIQLTDPSTYFINELLEISGVEKATLFSKET